MVDGVAIVLRDTGEWLASEAGVVLARREPAEVVAAPVRAGGLSASGVVILRV